MPHLNPRPAQLGVAVLHVTLILVLLASLGVFYAARGGITEQRISANEVRSQAAYQAALAGLDHAMGYFDAGQKVEEFAPGTGATAPQTSLLRGANYRVQFCSPAATPPTCAATVTPALACTPPASAELRSPMVVACGWSNDSTTVVRMVQLVAGAPVLSGSITTPIVTFGSNNMLTGGGSVLNYFNDLTVWSGGAVPTQSATGKTFVRNIVSDPVPLATADYRNAGTSPSCNNPPNHYVCSSSGTNVGPDVIANDTALSTLTASQFFATFMGSAPADYRASKVTYTVDGSKAASATNATSVGSIPTDKLYNQVIWIEGNVSSQIPDLGTATAPVIVIINGNWDVTGSPVINGLVVVTGNVSGNGSPTIYGALIANQVTINGNFKVVFDPTGLGLTQRLGRAGTVPGSFRDW
ncbi:PilX N-terminal domain-containing pilus assembly protein [Ramlibacter sp. MAHUQ-53]|uniref:PilX N-terminal domain-containing pilus assembly protein n=1 Tax=unclassified Ramlibacter TaxID=2617605 RepID=UPI00362F4F9F